MLNRDSKRDYLEYKIQRFGTKLWRLFADEYQLTNNFKIREFSKSWLNKIKTAKLPFGVLRWKTFSWVWLIWKIPGFFRENQSGSHVCRGFSASFALAATRLVTGTGRQGIGNRPFGFTLDCLDLLSKVQVLVCKYSFPFRFSFRVRLIEWLR